MTAKLKTFVALILTLSLLFAFGACNNEVETPLDQPAEIVYYQYRANFHTHTTRSDGDFEPSVMAGKYEALGYDILAITDHLVITDEWADFEPQSSLSYITGVEAEGVIAHINLFFQDIDLAIGAPELLLETNRIAGGLAVLNHPGRYIDKGVSTADRVKWFRDYPNLYAMEIINRKNRYPTDRVLWDEALTETMPDRIIYGVGADDAHDEDDIGWSWTMYIMPDTSSQSIRTAMETGSFYAVTRSIVENPVGETPRINSVTVTDGIVTVEGENYYNIVWYSCGDLVAEDTNTFDTSIADKYVRFELIGDGGIAFGQPIPIYD